MTGLTHTHTHKVKVLLAGALVGLVAANTQAAVISVQPVVAGYFDTNFNPIPAPDPLPIGGTDNTEFPTVVQIDVMLQVHALSPGEDSFGIAAFSFQFGSAFSSMTVDPIIPDPDAGGWAPNPHPNVDSNGPAPGGGVPLFSTNADLGVDSMDLQGILVSMATGAFTNSFDPRRNIGEGGSSLGVPFYLGSAFLEWNGTEKVYITLSPVQVSAKLTNGQFVVGEAVPANAVFVGYCYPGCPEPSSAALLGSCLMGMVLRRRVG